MVNTKALYRAYHAAPVFEDRAVEAWQMLMADTLTRFAFLVKGGLRVEFVDADPYADAAEMFAEIRAHKRLRVTRANSEHPVWTEAENVRFRAVHDYYAHFLTGLDFSLAGEVGAYEAHARLLPYKAQRALLVEVVAQAACFTFDGVFPVQKVFQL